MGQHDPESTPLLAGKQFFYNFVSQAKDILLPQVSPIYCLQTNGTLLTEDWLQVFDELNINIGVSIDGTKKINDMYRVDHKGRGSYDRIIKGYTMARDSQYLKIKPGLLSVINIHADPIETYEHLKTLRPRTVDFLLPEATYDRLPDKKEQDINSTPYADWLISIFDKWFYEKEKPFAVRIFETYMLAVFGISTGLDTLGETENEVLTIEADGGIEPIGSLKVCGNGFTKLGANVHTHSFDEALTTELAGMYHESGKRLCEKCRICPIREVCGGGYLPHRFSKQNAFDNPSVYCSDLMKLITHIQNKVIESLPHTFTERAKIKPLTFTQLKERMQINVAQAM